MWILAILATLIILPIIPECQRHKTVVINNSGSPIKATIRLGGILGEPLIWSGQLADSEVRRITSPVSGADSHDLRGRYLEGGAVFEAESEYAFGLGEITTVFIIKSDRVDHGYWDELGPPPDVEYGDDFALPRLALYLLPDLLNVMSCLDRDALVDIENVADSLLANW